MAIVQLDFIFAVLIGKIISGFKVCFEVRISFIETYATLHAKLLDLQSEMRELEVLIKGTESRGKQDDDEAQDLEQFMKELNSTKSEKSVSKLKYKLSQLRNEEERISKLEAIAKPTEILTKLPQTGTETELSEYGLRIVPENRKQEFLKKTTNVNKQITTVESDDKMEIEEKKKVYSVELPEYLKGMLSICYCVPKVVYLINLSISCTDDKQQKRQTKQNK